MIAVAHRAGPHAGDVAAGVGFREAVRRLASPAATRRDVLSLQLLRAVVEHRRHRQLRDEREQRRRRADPRDLLHADRVGEDAATLATVLLGERQPREAGAPATPPSSPTGTPRARRRRPRSGRCAVSASRRTDSRSSSYSSGRTNALISSPRYIVGWRASSGNWSSVIVRRHSSTALRLDRAAGAAAPREPRRPSPAGGSTRARHRARASAQHDERVVGAAVVAEQLTATSMSPITGARPNSAARAARDLGDHRDHVIDVLVSASRDAIGDALGERVRVADVRARTADQAPPCGDAASRSPGRSARQRRAGGSAMPGGRFCCWRGRSARSAGTNGSVGTPRTLLGVAARGHRPTLSSERRTGSSRAGPATTPR